MCLNAKSLIKEHAIGTSACSVIDQNETMKTDTKKETINLKKKYTSHGKNKKTSIQMTVSQPSYVYVTLNTLHGCGCLPSSVYI